MDEQQSKYYIISQRVLYMGLGLVAGYFFGIGQAYSGRIYLLVFVGLAVALSYYFNWKARK